MSFAHVRNWMLWLDFYLCVKWHFDCIYVYVDVLIMDMVRKAHIKSGDFSVI